MMLGPLTNFIDEERNSWVQTLATKKKNKTKQKNVAKCEISSIATQIIT